MWRARLKVEFVGLAWESTMATKLQIEVEDKVGVGVDGVWSC